MGKCKYCGLNAGLFSHSHKECEEKHVKGLEVLDNSFYAYLRSENDASGLGTNIRDVKSQNFIQESDVAVSAAKIIDRYTDELKLPYKSTILPKIQELIRQTGLSYQQVNLTGSLDKLSQKLIKGFLAEYFMGKKPLQRALQIAQQIRSSLPIPDTKLNEAYMKILEKASHNFMKDGTITSGEQQLLDDFTNTLGINLNNLPAEYHSEEMDQIEQGRILSKGHPVEHSYMNKEGEGNLYVTNKHIIFQSPTKSLKVAYNKMIGITPYSDGMELQRDGANARRVTLQGFDCSFIFNILSLINI